MDADPKDLEAYLHAHIPLSAYMGVTVVSAGDDGVRLWAPLEPNLNHRGTVFGGSASALAILAGWTLVHARMRRMPFPVRIVIRRNAVEYDRPLPEAFEAFCPSPPDEVWEAFEEALARRSKARLTVSATLASGGETVGSFTGEYVVLRLDAA